MRFEPGDWCLLAIGLVWSGAAVAYGMRRRWAEMVLAVCYGTATFVTLFLAVRGRR